MDVFILVLFIYLGLRKDNQSKEKELSSKKALRDKKKGEKKEKPVSKKVKKDGKDSQKGNKAIETGYMYIFFVRKLLYNYSVSV